MLKSKIESYTIVARPVVSPDGRTENSTAVIRKAAFATLLLSQNSRNSSVENFGQSEHGTCHSWQQERRGCVRGVFARPTACSRPHLTQRGSFKARKQSCRARAMSTRTTQTFLYSASATRAARIRVSEPNMARYRAHTAHFSSAFVRHRPQ